MSAFDDCLNFVLAEEGPPSDNPTDPGGYTKFGIAQNYHPNVDVRNLTRDGAAEIYLEQYWNPTHCDALDRSVALCVFDSAINLSPKEAIELLQTAIGATVDGKFGPQTLELYHEARSDLTSIVMSFHDARETMYRAKAGFIHFGHGWMNRNNSCESLALSWIGAGNG